jgi:hypothetical protein
MRRARRLDAAPPPQPPLPENRRILSLFHMFITAMQSGRFFLPERLVKTKMLVYRTRT